MTPCADRHIAYIPAHDCPWQVGGFPIFGISFPLAVASAASFGRAEPHGYVLPKVLFYSKS